MTQIYHPKMIERKTYFNKKFQTLFLFTFVAGVYSQNTPFIELDLSLQNSGGLTLLEGDKSPPILYNYINFDTINGGACQQFDNSDILVEMENGQMVSRRSDVIVTNNSISGSGSFSFTFIASVNDDEGNCIICSFYSDVFYPVTTCLNVFVKAPPKVEIRVRPQYVDAGDTVVVTCIFSGYPFPDIEFSPKRILPFTSLETLSKSSDKLKVLKYVAVIRRIDASWNDEVIQCITRANSDFAGITESARLEVRFRRRRHQGLVTIIIICSAAIFLLILILLIAGYVFSVRRRVQACDSQSQCDIQIKPDDNANCAISVNNYNVPPNNFACDNTIRYERCPTTNATNMNINPDPVVRIDPNSCCYAAQKNCLSQPYQNLLQQQYIPTQPIQQQTSQLCQCSQPQQQTQKCSHKKHVHVSAGTVI